MMLYLSMIQFPLEKSYLLHKIYYTFSLFHEHGGFLDENHTRLLYLQNSIIVACYPSIIIVMQIY